MNFRNIKSIDELLKLAAQTVKSFVDAYIATGGQITTKEVIDLLESAYHTKIEENYVIQEIDRWLIDQYSQNKESLKPLVDNKEIYGILQGAKRYKHILKKLFGSSDPRTYTFKNLEKNVEKIQNAVGFLSDFKEQLPENKKLIQNYNSEEELDEMINYLSYLISKKEINSDIVYEDDKWKIEIPKTHEDAILLATKARQGFIDPDLLAYEDQNKTWCFGINNEEGSLYNFKRFSPIAIFTYKPNDLMFATDDHSGYFQDGHDNKINAGKFVAKYNPPEQFLSVLYPMSTEEVLYPNKEIKQKFFEALKERTIDYTTPNTEILGNYPKPRLGKLNYQDEDWMVTTPNSIEEIEALGFYIPEKTYEIIKKLESPVLIINKKDLDETYLFHLGTQLFEGSTNRKGVYSLQSFIQSLYKKNANGERFYTRGSSNFEDFLTDLENDLLQEHGERRGDLEFVLLGEVVDKELPTELQEFFLQKEIVWAEEFMETYEKEEDFKYNVKRYINDIISDYGYCEVDEIYWDSVSIYWRGVFEKIDLDDLAAILYDHRIKKMEEEGQLNIFEKPKELEEEEQ